ncbi:MAG: hypothetical protein B6D72_11370 [gamma proteobacterium symbiont of Ctena orbiculata]|uniref:Uncharacterized protein n=1 Tax=Candidatus Thiodiazotropha taylori TaxID=2792791 RepID=A0A944QUC3_9GAMM|nr:hypothetical protein [Candidatus Thiodiazotropha taylori]PUB89143.1 MAG: hypothetical protein DBP00_03315 [gamma proteobacterium symbiont of Ctena orbiculata]MBT2988774.1 hypothetical protein [Candidatus Thiodiazotropha taylori]MBT2998615.1 hypothetical protein [Candidatus Thiodiazotropha taylori]MBT3001469.1 hypothetical protein [Candidatus Thiodiazotropha taylori]
MDNSNGNNPLLWSLLGLLFAAICIVALYKSWPMLFPKAAVKAAVDPACDLRAGPCTTRLESGGSVTFSIVPREIPTVAPLELQVNLQGMEASAIEVDFSGVEMNMGLNRVKLSSGEEGVFGGRGMLPVCVWDAMEWEARVLIETEQGLISVPFRFITVRPGLSLPGADS